MGSFFGDSPDEIAAPDYTKLDPVVDALYGQLNNNQPWNSKTVGQQQFDYNANQATQNVLNATAATKGARASQIASAVNNSSRNMQHDNLGVAAVRDAMERQNAQQQLAQIIMGQEAQKANVAQANAQIQANNQAAQDRMIGMGLTAAGYAFGGPAGGMAAGAMTSGMGSGGGGGGVDMMGANPYAGAPAPSTYQQYNPNNYNMGQALKYNSGF